MTLISLITVNAVLATAIIYGIVSLLSHGVRTDLQRVEAEVRELPQHIRDRIAA